MLNSVSAGPPQGPLSWNSSKPDKVEESKGSFDKALAEKVSPKEDTKVSQGDKSQVAKKDDAEVSTDRKVSKQEDRKEEVVEVKQSPLQKKAANLRQKAIAGFMDSFESEFNIPPTRLVEAMAQLPAEDLDKNPEETADLVIAQLDLSEDQEKQAKQMYMSLVSDLSRIDKAALPPTVVTADAHAMMESQLKERFAIQQEKKTMLNQSLGKMNDQFFMKPDALPPAQNPEGKVQVQKSIDRPEGLEAGAEIENGMKEDLAKVKDPSAPFKDLPVQDRPVAPNLPDQGMNSASVQSKNEAPQTNLLQQLKKLSEQPPENVQGQKVLPEALRPQAVKTEASVKALNQAAVPVAGVMSKNAQAQQQGEGFAGKNSDKNSGKENGKESVAKNSGKSASDESLNILSVAKDAAPSAPISPNASPAETSTPFRSSPVVGATGMAGASSSKSEPKDVNIRQIMNQAQYLIKKGGGEVKVEMSPEGLGQVHLKMAIHDGKVNLQMATETPEAKQAIENGMSELKSSLAAHKLSVDHVKVDVVGSSSAGSAADNSSQSFNQQAQRDTRQFWNQFQESFGNRSQQESFSDAPGLKGYGTQRRDPLTAVEGTSTAKNRDVEGKGSGLNLVA